MADSFNVADLLARAACEQPEALAVAMPSGPRGARRTYQQTTFKQLHQESDCLAAGMLRSGIRPGMPIVLMVPFSTSFIRWVFFIRVWGY